MHRESPPHVALALGLVFSASWLAYGALGGGDGVVLSYQGRLELNGVTVINPVNLEFEVYNQESGGSPCWSGTVNGVTTRDGAFSTSFGPVTESCVKDRDVWLALLVDEVALDGRQKITPVLSSLTSGRGDHFVAGQLQSASASVTGTVSAGSISAAGGNFTGTVSFSGDGTLLDVGGAAVIDSLDVTEQLNVDGDLDVVGTVTWSCPAGTNRVGAWCMTTSQGSAGSVGGPLAACHNKGMRVCPLEAILTCDQVGLPAGGEECGAVTDRSFGQATGNFIMTGTPSVTDGIQESFDAVTCFSQEFPGFPANVQYSCNSAHHFYCCAPVSAASP